MKKELFSRKALMNLIIPLIAELALKLVVGMIDSMMISSSGEAAVSAVYLVDSIIQLLIYVFAAVAAGGAIVAGQYLGAGRKQDAEHAANELMWLNALISIAVMLLILPTSNTILKIFGAVEEDVYRYAHKYYMYVMLSIPAIAIFEAGSSILRTVNQTKITLKLSLMMNLINCVGNAILIYGLSMDTAGAAIATTVSRWTAAIFVLVILTNQDRELYVEKTLRHRLDGATAKKICALGIPGGIENGIFQLGKIMVLSLTATFGTSAIAANTVAQTLSSIEVVPGSAISLAMVTVIARAMGTGDMEQVKAYNLKMLRISYAMIWVWSAIMCAGLPFIVSLYNLTEETAQITYKLFMLHTLGSITLWPLAWNQPAALRAAGDVRFPMVISILSMWIMRYGGAYLLGSGLGLGVVGVWIAMAVLDWGFRGTIFAARWHSGKWQDKGILKKAAPPQGSPVQSITQKPASRQMTSA